MAAKTLVIGLLGGVASGKSTVAKLLEERGAVRLDADAVGHEALADENIRKQVVDYFGETILDRERSVDRKLLAQRVFGRPEELKVLADITHPWIGATLHERLVTLRASQVHPAICLDVSLLLESGRYEQDVDLLVFVDTDQEQRKERAQKTRGWQESEVGKREAHQMPLAEKKKRADFIITNNGNLEDLKAQIDNFWNQYIT